MNFKIFHNNLSGHILILLKICDVMCSFFEDLKFDILVENSSAQSASFAYRFNLRLLKQCYSLSFPSGSDFAVVNIKTANGLRSLMGFPSIRYEVYITAREWAEKLKLWKIKANKVKLTATINVYGSREISGMAGHRLSKAGLYLQHPDHCDPTSQYENPHFFKLPQTYFPEPDSFSNDTIEILPIQPMSLPNYSGVFDTLSRHKYLRHSEIDPRIITPLLPFVEFHMSF